MLVRHDTVSPSLIVTQIASRPPPPVTPAKAGVHLSAIALIPAWTPAFAGVTMGRALD